MKWAANKKIVLQLGAIILLSGVIGGLVGFRVAVQVFKRKTNPEQWNVSVMHHLERRLKLTPEQVVRVQADIDQAVEEMKGIRVDTIARTSQVIERLVGNVDQEMITPEQKAEFAMIKKERHDASLELLLVEPRKRKTTDGSKK